MEFFCILLQCKQSLLSLPCTSKKNVSFHFKRYNLTIRAVNFFETFCACSLSSLGQDPMAKIPKKDFFVFLFFLLGLEMADLSIFLRKMTFLLQRLKGFIIQMFVKH
jgi:hypothetical protein